VSMKGSVGAWALALVAWSTLAPVVRAAEPPAGAHPLSLPRPAFLAHGVPSLVDLPRYQECGFNALYVVLSPPLEGDARTRLLDVLKACERLALPVVVELAAAPADALSLVSPYDPEYVVKAGEWIGGIVGDLRKYPAVCAWAVPSRASRVYTPDDVDFREYLTQRYEALAALRVAWSAVLPTWDSVSLARATPLGASPMLSVSRPALDAAEYRMAAQRKLLAQWLQTITQSDRSRPVWVGSEPSPAALACVPEGFAGAFVAPPSGMEDADWRDFLPAVALGRRGGRLDAIIEVPARRAVIESYGDLVLEAVAQGAAGVALDSWRLAKTNAAVREGLREAAEVCVEQGLAHFQPRPSVAVYHLPYADGAVTAGGDGVFGYLAGFSPGEPSLLVSTYATGHRYGLVDYIGPEAVLAGRLRQYGVVLAPHCLDLPPPILRAFIDFVNGGGILVLDIGAGVAQTNNFLLFPPGLEMLTGVTRLGRVFMAPMNVTVKDAPAPFSSLPPNAVSVGVGGGAAFTGGVGDAILSLGARVVAESHGRRAELGHLYRGGILANSFGAGYCVFCTGRLFASWSPEDPLYQAMFSDLFARGALIENVAAEGLFGRDLTVSGGANGFVIHNRSDAPAQARLRVSAEAGALTRSVWAHYPPASAGRRAFEAVADLAAGQCLYSAAVPVAVEGATWWALVERYGPEEIRLRLVDGRAPVPAPGDEPVAETGAQPLVGDLEIRIASGMYRVEPLSRHVVATRSGPDRAAAGAARFVAADDEGVLHLSVDSGGGTVIVRPESTEEPSSNAG